MTGSSRWSAGSEDDTRKYAAELVALAPDVIFISGSAAVGPLQRVTRTVPIVFALVPDPVGAGFVESLGRPGGNTPGFTPYEYSLGAKWLELLKQIAPSVTRVAVLRDPAITAGIGLWGAIQSASPSFGVELRPVDVRDVGEIERALTAFARSPNGGLILTGSALGTRPRRRGDRMRTGIAGLAVNSSHFDSAMGPNNVRLLALRWGASPCVY